MGLNVGGEHDLTAGVASAAVAEPSVAASSPLESKSRIMERIVPGRETPRGGESLR